METITLFNQACANHDPDAAFAQCSEELVFESTEPAPDGARYVGIAAVRAVLEPLLVDPATSFELEETIECGERVIQRSRYSWGDGHIRAVDLFTVRDGLIVELLSYVKG